MMASNFSARTILSSTLSPQREEVPLLRSGIAWQTRGLSVSRGVPGRKNDLAIVSFQTARNSNERHRSWRWLAHKGDHPRGCQDVSCAKPRMTANRLTVRQPVAEQVTAKRCHDQKSEGEVRDGGKRGPWDAPTQHGHPANGETDSKKDDALGVAGWIHERPRIMTDSKSSNPKRRALAHSKLLLTLVPPPQVLNRIGREQPRCYAANQTRPGSAARARTSVLPELDRHSWRRHMRAGAFDYQPTLAVTWSRAAGLAM